jgi:hypothetical protein
MHLENPFQFGPVLAGLDVSIEKPQSGQHAIANLGTYLE